MITENISTLKIHKLTQEQYDRELASGNLDESALYLTPDEDGNYATQEYVDNAIATIPKDDIEELKELVGETSVSDQINAALADMSAPDVSGQISAHNDSNVAHNDIRNTINNLPISVDDEGFTDVYGLRRLTNWNATRHANTVTLTLTFEGGVTTTDVINFDANGYPSSIVSDGFEVLGTWIGFDDGGEG